MKIIPVMIVALLALSCSEPRCVSTVNIDQYQVFYQRYDPYANRYEFYGSSGAPIDAAKIVGYPEDQWHRILDTPVFRTTKEAFIPSGSANKIGYIKKTGLYLQFSLPSPFEGLVVDEPNDIRSLVISFANQSALTLPASKVRAECVFMGGRSVKGGTTYDDYCLVIGEVSLAALKNITSIEVSYRIKADLPESSPANLRCLQQGVIRLPHRN